MFLKNGFTATDTIKQASVIIIATCVNTSYDEELSFETIAEVFSKKNRDAEVIITGCATELYKYRLQKMFDCFIVPLHMLNMVVERYNFSIMPDVCECRENIFLNSRVKRWQKLWKYLYVLYKFSAIFLPFKSNVLKRYLNAIYEYSPNSYFLKIGRGCGNSCTFCLTGIAIGPSRSRNPDDIIKEIESALSKGYEHFLLVSDDFTSYGLDIGLTFVDLLERIFLLKKVFTLTIKSFNPTRCLAHLDRFIACLEPGRIKCIEYLIQSGSNEVLKRMNRGYTREDVIAIADAILSKDSDIILKTMFIVGFPGETENDFNETVSVFERILIEKAAIFHYNIRPGTVAADLYPKIPLWIMKTRKRILQYKIAKSCLKRLLA